MDVRHVDLALWPLLLVQKHKNRCHRYRGKSVFLEMPFVVNHLLRNSSR
jgi:hypothetical protein